MRRAVEVFVGIGLVALVARAWLAGPPLVVEGPSMAPTLLGRHFQVTCAQCAFPFACDADRMPRDERAPCPNCGFAGNDLSGLQVRAGQTLRVNRAAYRHRGPQRWDVALLREPDDPRQLCVKRVVGLPGERVALREGDLFIDGRRVRKPWPVAQALAVPVNDSSYRARVAGRLTQPPAPERWQAAESASGWQQHEGGFQRAADSLTGEAACDWLIYQHRVASTADAAPAPIGDDLAYNAAESRLVEPALDLLLRCWLRAEGKGQLRVKIHDGRQWFEVRLGNDGRGQLYRADRPIMQFALHARALERPTKLELAVIDCQLWLAVDDRLIVAQSYEPGALAREALPAPMAIGASGPSVSILRLQVLRDVNYLAAGPSSSIPLSEQLGPDEYCVLGDNSSVSLDSRTWTLPVHGALVLGKVTP